MYDAKGHRCLSPRRIIMKTSADLRNLLNSIHRKSYPAYKSLQGEYAFADYRLSIDHVQGDPFASPSSLSLFIRHDKANFPEAFRKDSITRTALADYLIRQFEKQISHYSFQAKGSGKSGLLSVSHCGQEVLPRTALKITDQGLIARFHAGFPANGRTINAPELEKILFQYLPECVKKAFFYSSLSPREVKQAIDLAEDQTAIRRELKARNLIAFVADGSILPRQSGVSQRPMKNSVPFSSPKSLKVTLNLPHRGELSGMGIPQGITLIVGGGYHGKSTLLNALQLGVYNHIAGDGREYVITDDTAVKLRSEDGRFIKDVDISLFINDLPDKRDTRRFSTEDASGSTSQAAGIVESMEAGSRVFLMDEDTSATNFMVRDAFMQQVICREKEPITPFVERAKALHEHAGISTILVAGSSGAFFHIADTILQMDCYQTRDITSSVKELCKEYPPAFQGVPAFTLPRSQRIFAPAKAASGDRREHGRPMKTKVRGKDEFSLGHDSIDLRYVEQIADSEQTASLALILRYGIEHYADGKRSIRQIIELLWKQLEDKGLDFLWGNSYVPCGYAMPRLQEIYACFNRYRR